MTLASQNFRQDDDFPIVASAIQRTATAAKPPFFRTAVGDLFAIYLSGFTADVRQTFNCHCCRRFLEQFGDLVTIDERGQTRSVFWADADQAPDVYRDAFVNLRLTVETANVVGVHYSAEATWGLGMTHDKKRGHDWQHFCVPSLQQFNHPLKNAFQASAEVREELGMLERGLGEFSREVILQAKTLLDTEQLYRSEKTLGVATWLLGLHDALAGLKHEQRRQNILWRATALAPAGFCHVRSTMIGTLLEDLAQSTMDFETVKRRFAEKMHPLQYRRSQAEPSDENIAQAEEIFAKLKSAGSLERRFAKLEDIEKLWAPNYAREMPEAEGGVFGHLKTTVKESSTDVGSAVTMTWEKFARTVLPTAEKVELMVPRFGNFIALVTSLLADAPPILQWDREERRNPVSWFIYMNGSPAANWNLVSSEWCEVTAVTPLPPMWHGSPIKHHGEGAILILKGARDTAHEAGGGLFTENLRSEYHPVRRTLEAYVKKAPIAGRDEATACGYDLRKGSTLNTTVRVTSKGVRTSYYLDRWD